MNEDERFVSWYHQFFDEFMKENPIAATFFGKHEYDHLLGELSTEQAIRQYERSMAYWKELKEKFDRSKLSFDNQIDYELLDHYFEQTRFNFETLQTWKTGYRNSGPVGTIGGGLFPLLTGEFAPFIKRAESIVERMERVPNFLEKSKDIWKEPVELWTQLAIQECDSMPGLLQFLSGVIEQDPGAGDDLKQRAVKASNTAIKSIKTYRTFLEQEVLPKASRNWCTGEGIFSKLLKLRKLPYTGDKILEMGWKHYEETKTELEKLASEIALGKSFDEVRELLNGDYPETYDTVLEHYTEAVTEARKFIIEKKIASMPNQGEEFVEVKETPEYMSPLIPLAAYIPPAYLDPVKKGIYLVTKPKDNSLLRDHSRIGILNTSVHESYPGHHMHMSVASLNASLIRTFVFANETAEGWAHYCEQMMFEEGYLKGKEFEFIQKLDSLWRAVRLIVDIELSRGRITFEEAIDFIVEKAGKSRETAIAIVSHCTTSPGFHLSYLTGKRLILGLREKVFDKLGDRFNLKFFHDVILKNGCIPYYFLEQVMEREVEMLLKKI
ncbi:MAG: DUF885 domain-containing protein [Candidatus Hodarchaeales archaeon]|jgi:uncharacterized protein (DUF885 family)